MIHGGYTVPSDLNESEYISYIESKLSGCTVNSLEKVTTDTITLTNEYEKDEKFTVTTVPCLYWMSMTDHLWKETPQTRLVTIIREGETLPETNTGAKVDTKTDVSSDAKTTVDVTPVVNIDTKTNIKLNTDTDVVPNDTVLNVTSITEGNTYNTVKKALTGISKFVVYDINLMSNGGKVQPNGKVKISIPIPSEYNKSNLVVYRMDNEENKVEYPVTVEGDYATFETNHFSTYILAEKETTTEKDDTPKTGTQDLTYIVMAVAVMSAVGIIVLKKKEQR